jgi:hypothetical protein
MGADAVAAPPPAPTVPQALAQAAFLPAWAKNQPAIPNALTLASFGLGLWWSVGGPTWAGLVSIGLDEVDGRWARLTGSTSEAGSALDWGTDVALVPMALRRLGAAFGHPDAALLAAPPILYVQAQDRAAGTRPAVGSARAVIMVAAMLAEAVR